MVVRVKTQGARGEIGVTRCLPQCKRFRHLFRGLEKIVGLHASLEYTPSVDYNTLSTSWLCETDCLTWVHSV